jgi:hypothetical protein
VATLLNEVRGAGTYEEVFDASNLTSGVYFYRLQTGNYTDVKKMELPKAFALRQNYPNPFNPTTTIRFALPKTSNVQLEIYNILGQRVVTLVNEVREAGYYNELFNANNIASGVYFYRLQAEGYTNVKKLVVLK